MSFVSNRVEFPPVSPPIVSKAWFDIDQSNNELKTLNEIEKCYEEISTELKQTCQNLRPIGCHDANKSGGASSHHLHQTRGAGDIYGTLSSTGNTNLGALHQNPAGTVNFFDEEDAAESDAGEEELTDLSDQAESMITDPDHIQDVASPVSPGYE